MGLNLFIEIEKNLKRTVKLESTARSHTEFIATRISRYDPLLEDTDMLEASCHRQVCCSGKEFRASQIKLYIFGLCREVTAGKEG